MKKFAIIGYPLKHSASPGIHNTAFQYYRMDAAYDKLEIDPVQFDVKLSKIKKESWSGFNVTIPYKQSIMTYLDRIDKAAQRIGAVNTVKVENDGSWSGYNTDYVGFLQPLEPYHPQIRSGLLAGAGGAARAVAFALCDLPYIERICLLVRSKQKGEMLLQDLKKYKSIEYYLVEMGNDKSEREYDLLVNATPVGMGELRGQMPFEPQSYAHKNTVVYDLIYNPVETIFLQAAKRTGLHIINGWPMLLGQAEEAFRIWTGKGFTIEIKQRVEKELR